jgi:DNA-binding GntR family transcriptional regulator
MPDSPTLSAQVYRDLRNAILIGTYPPGAHLTLRALAEELGTSVMPVRDAVQRLAAERAVVLSPNRSIRIPPLDRAEVEQLWRLRILVEGDVCLLAAGRATQVQLDTVATMNAAAGKLYRAKQLSDFIAKISAIGDVLAQAAGAALHAELIGNLRLRSGPHMALALRPEATIDSAFVNFTLAMTVEVVAALREGDGERARDARRVDLQTFQRFIFDRLGWQRQDQAPPRRPVGATPGAEDPRMPSMACTVSRTRSRM